MNMAISIAPSTPPPKQLYRCSQAATATCPHPSISCPHRKPHTHMSGHAYSILCWNGKTRIECRAMTPEEISAAKESEK